MRPLRPPGLPHLPSREDPRVAAARRAFALDVVLTIAITLALIGAGQLAWTFGRGHGTSAPPPLAWQAFIGSGAIACWGDNSSYPLGDNTLNDHPYAAIATGDILSATCAM